MPQRSRGSWRRALLPRFVADSIAHPSCRRPCSASRYKNIYSICTSNSSLETMTKRHPCPAAFWSQRLRCCSAAKRLPRRSSTAPPLDHSVHAGLRVAGRPDCAVQEVQGLETANAILNQRAASQKAVTGGDAGWEGSSGVFASDEDGYVQKHEARVQKSPTYSHKDAKSRP